MVERQPPRFRGVSTYKDPLGRFSLRYPSDWYQFELEDEREGVMYSPQAENPRTWVAAWISRLDEKVVAEDLEDLRLGVNEGLSQLAECKVEAESEETHGKLVQFERV